MKCPKCQSLDVVHKNHDPELEENCHNMKHHAVVGAGHALQGHPATFLLATGVLLAVKAAQKLAKPWRCRTCGHMFS